MNLKDLLKKNNFSATTILSIERFKLLPITSKDNYIKKYDLIYHFAEQDVTKTTTISAISGTTG